jgi:protein O-GlcNAc transferase
MLIINAHIQQVYPQIFSLWMDIVRRVPGSVLWLLRFDLASHSFLPCWVSVSRRFPASAEARLKAAAAQAGIDPDRIVFSDKVFPLSSLVSKSLF